MWGSDHQEEEEEKESSIPDGGNIAVSSESPVVSSDTVSEARSEVPSVSDDGEEWESAVSSESQDTDHSGGVGTVLHHDDR